VIPFLFWRGTWFGRALTDQEIAEYLEDSDHPRHEQHALVQIAQRLGRGDASVRRWYPQVTHLVNSPHSEIRVTLAWLMGADPESEDFHRALSGLLPDPDPLVRRNAALSLVRFGDSSGRPELLNMLRPLTVAAPRAGAIHYRMNEGASAEHGSTLAELSTPGSEPFNIQAPVPGRIQRRIVAEGQQVREGEPVVILSPGADHAWEALRALYLVGTSDDLPEVEQFASGAMPDETEKLKEQAALTAAEIRKRAGAGTSTQAPAR
jgi:hypothetical protein